MKSTRKRPVPPPKLRQPLPTKVPPPPVIPTFTCEADVAEGLERIARRELRTRFEDRVEFDDQQLKPGVLRFSYTGNLYQLTRLQMIQAVYLVQHYPIPRPKALLGDQHFKTLLAQIAAVREVSSPDAYKTFNISAAGSESSVMRRLRDELAARIGLQPADEGDLLIRLRHPPGSDEGWETLVRLSPRPLATRAWRVCNREGALNATVAHAMAFMTQPHSEDVFLNMACGSGTLMIERLAQGGAKEILGYDIDPQALECARQNIEAAGLSEQVKLRLGDARDLPLGNKSVDAICADLPFGHLVGSHDDNLILYPALRKEAARGAKRGARCVLISHEVRLLEGLLDESAVWDKQQVIRVALGGLYPRIFVLQRR